MDRHYLTLSCTTFKFIFSLPQMLCHGWKSGAWVFGLSVILGLVLPAQGQVNPYSALEESASTNEEDFGQFSRSMVEGGDFNGDGTPDLIVGASGEDNLSTNDGRVYLVSGADGSVLRILVSPNPNSSGFFGRSVGSVKDLNGDGTSEVVVGAPGENAGGFDASGRAYVIDATDGSLLLTLESENIESNGLFGSSVGGVGDINGDASPEIVVGAPRENVGSETNAGRAYVFSGTGGSVTLTLVSKNTETDGEFGRSVAGISDATGDGISDIVVGAPVETVNGTNRAGRIYLFDGTDGSAFRTVLSPNPTDGGRFGTDVVDLGDVGGDSATDILIGAKGEIASGISLAGRAYVIDGGNGSALQSFTSSNPETNGFFGNSVAALGDTDGDGATDVIVGAPEETVGSTSSAGRAYLFSGSSGASIATLTAPNPQDDAQFGFSVAGISGAVPTHPAVGAYLEDTGSFTESGRVYLFTPAVALTDGRDGESYSPPSPTPGTEANPIGRFRLDVGGVGPSLEEVTVTNFAPTPSGVSNIELWTSTDGTFDATGDTQIASQGYSDAAAFSSLGTPIPFDGIYVFVVVDLESAVRGNHEPVVVDETDIGFADGPLVTYNGSATPTFTDAFLSDASSPLPVELAAFDAEVTSDRSVRLQWQTTSETGNRGFRVQRSVSGTSWSPLGRVEGAGTTDAPQSYRFTDSSVPYAADSLLYRLAQVDGDGAVNVSDPVTVRFGNPNGLELLGSFPNPARSQATIRFAVPEQTTGEGRLGLYDLLGRQVKTLPAAEASGRVEQTLDVSDLPSGTYLLRLSAGGQTRTQQVTIVR